MPDLSSLDRIVLDEISRLQSGCERVMYDSLCESRALSAVPQQEWVAAVERLDKRGLVKMRHAFGVPFAYVSMTDLGTQILASRGQASD